MTDLDIKMQAAVSQHMTQKNGVGMGGAVGTYGGTSASIPGGVSADTKPQRTVYIGNCKHPISEQSLTEYLNNLVVKVPGRTNASMSPIHNCSVNSAKCYAFVEFTNIQDTDICICMDGCAHSGHVLRIRRPKTYAPPPGYDESNKTKYRIPGLIGTHVEDGPNKIFLGNIPKHLGDLEVQEIAASIGELSAFTLVRDLVTGEPKGYAFFSYSNPSLTSVAVAALEGLPVAGVKLSCKQSHAAQAATGMMAVLAGAGQSGAAIDPQMMQMLQAGMQNAAAVLPGGAVVPTAPMPTATAGAPSMVPIGVPSRVLQFENMVEEAELKDDEEYAEIVEDIEEECMKYGPLARKVVIPRPGSAAEPSDVGKIFLEYKDVGSAIKAATEIARRQFNQRVIVVNYVNEVDWQAKALNYPG